MEGGLSKLRALRRVKQRSAVCFTTKTDPAQHKKGINIEVDIFFVWFGILTVPSR